MADDYPCPLRDPRDPGRPPAPVAVDVPRPAGGRRLAILDTHFPWRLSGFRFHEFDEIRRRRPDTVIFSLHAMAEPYDAPVLPLADFPVVAPALGITDVYAVFLNFVVGLLGMSGRFAVPGRRADISIVPTLERHGMRFHSQLYPGGGLLPTTSPDVLRAVAAASSTSFTNVEEALVGGVDYVAGAVVDVDLYRLVERPEREELHLLFAGADSPRKGLATMIDAFNLLPEGYHLHIVGPHERHRAALTNPRHTFHGWLGIEELRDLCEACDVVVAPLTADQSGQDGVHPAMGGMVDGFPTTAASNAMATGCCLLASNPRHDTRVFTPGVDYLEFAERDAEALAALLVELGADRSRLRSVGRRGAATARERLSVQAGVDAKLRLMGLEDTTVRDVGRDVAALHAAGVHLLEHGDAGHALAAFAAAMRIGLGDDLLNDAAVTLVAAGRTEAASSLLDAALFADPGNVDARENRSALARVESVA